MTAVLKRILTISIVMAILATAAMVFVIWAWIDEEQEEQLELPTVAYDRGEIPGINDTTWRSSSNLPNAKPGRAQIFIIKDGLYPAAGNGTTVYTVPEGKGIIAYRLQLYNNSLADMDYEIVLAIRTARQQIIPIAGRTTLNIQASAPTLVLGTPILSGEELVIFGRSGLEGWVEFDEYDMTSAGPKRLTFSESKREYRYTSPPGMATYFLNIWPTYFQLILNVNGRGYIYHNSTIPVNHRFSMYRDNFKLYENDELTNSSLYGPTFPVGEALFNPMFLFPDETLRIVVDENIANAEHSLAFPILELPWP